MSANLYKVSKCLWAVTTTSTEEEPHCFNTPEAAFEQLEKLGVNTDDIDVAIISMASQGDSRANFGTDGTFIFTDNKTLTIGST